MEEERKSLRSWVKIRDLMEGSERWVLSSAGVLGTLTKIPARSDVPGKIPPSTPPKTKFLPRSFPNDRFILFQRSVWNSLSCSRALGRPWLGKRRKGALAGFVQFEPPVCPPRAKGSGQRGLPSGMPAAEADLLPPSIPGSPWGSRRDAEDRGLPHLHRRPAPATPDVPDAHLSSLHGLALEIRRDNDVSSLSFFLYFCFWFCFSFTKQ